MVLNFGQISWKLLLNSTILQEEPETMINVSGSFYVLVSMIKLKIRLY